MNNCTGPSQIHSWLTNILYLMAVSIIFGRQRSIAGTDLVLSFAYNLQGCFCNVVMLFYSHVAIKEQIRNKIYYTLSSYNDESVCDERKST